MTRSVYIIGGAGTGKSTFTAQLLDGLEFGELEDLHALANKKNIVTLRGHRMVNDGMYLGLMRESFPGTDGLDRASSPVAESWLYDGNLPEWIVSEGATLATRRFLIALAQVTELLVVHLVADDFVKELRFLERGSDQDPKFVLATTTRSYNLFNDMGRTGCDLLEVDTSDPGAWADALDQCWIHLWSGRELL